MKIRKLGDLTKPIIEMLEDVGLAEEALDEKDTPYARRNYVRALFAMIEGTIFALKQTTLTGGLSAPKLLSVAELAILQEVSFDLTNKGDVKSQTKFFRMAENLRFTASIVSKVFQCNLELSVGTKDWDNFLKAIEIRNRITHPKSSTEFQVSDEEIKVARDVSLWFNQFTHNAVKGIQARITKPRSNNSFNRSAD
ncbi:MAG TPA: hypothetical protein VE732_07275 [Nitrososphaera sp.]|jgi:hypothetical protein|nr:hypothetical protein [Nitrososphaera sp.]